MSPVTEFIVYGGAKPTKHLIDFWMKNEIKMMRRWDRWGIQDLIPTNSSTLVSALNNRLLSPPRGQQYVLELILGSIRTEKHIARMLGIEKRKCAVCGHEDKIEHMLLFCSNAQIIWLTIVKFIKKFIKLEIKVTTKLIFLNETKDITNKVQRAVVKKSFATGVHFLFREYYQRSGVLTSSYIAGEMRRRLIDTFYSEKKRLEHMDLDVEINSNELKQLVEGLGEDELRTGKGNLVVWLRSQHSTRLLEPELELTDDFITYHKPRKPPASEKIIRWSKVFGIMETLGLLSV